MTELEFFKILIDAASIIELEAAINAFENERHAQISWVPFGNRPNNRGAIEVATDPGRSLVERLTNGIDAVLESEHEKHGGLPICRSPKEAAIAWLNLPVGGLSDMSPRERRTLAQRVTLQMLSGEGAESRLIVIRDYGSGISPDQMQITILSLNESNKWQKHYLAGTYGQGGSSTLAMSNYTVIVSKYNGYPQVGFTIVRYLDLPAETYKTGHYVYLTLNRSVIEAEVPLEVFSSGTLIKHFGYDLSRYKSPVGPNSLYGLLNQVLFDPVMPIWLDNQVHGYRRVIKGSRNALNGALDEGDEERRGPSLSHHVRMFYVALGEYGSIGIEYWVLEQPKEEKKPIAAFVNPTKPIILTSNGQNHDELHRDIIKKEADLPYLIQRVICHVDCNSLTPNAKRLLFSSTREGTRFGIVRDIIHQEVVKALKSDDELIRLNNEARHQLIQERDETELFEMRKEVARLLQLQGLAVAEALGGSVVSESKTEREKPTHPHRPRPIKPVLELREPPSYIRIVWEENKPITFYAEQRRYIRIETDAHSMYHDSNNPAKSRINIITTNGDVIFCGSTPLQGGRLRAIFEAKSGAHIGKAGQIRVELTRPGLPVLFDERQYLIEEVPPAKPSAHQLTLPPFEVRSVHGTEDPLWNTLDWPEDVNAVASTAILEDNKLIIYYSEVFPKFAKQLIDFERRSPVDAVSFTKRYEIWLAVHSLLLHSQQHQAVLHDLPEQQEEFERQERCRIATLACLFASREIHLGVKTLEAD